MAVSFMLGVAVGVQVARGDDEVQLTLMQFVVGLDRPPVRSDDGEANRSCERLLW